MSHQKLKNSGLTEESLKEELKTQTVSKVAKKYEVATVTIWRWCQKLGIKNIRPMGRPKRIEEAARV